MTESQLSSSPEHPLPRIVNGENTNTYIDAQEAAKTMRELGISDGLLEKTTIYVDPENRLITNGTAYPQHLGHWRFDRSSQLAKAPGPIVRISTTMRGKPRDEEAMNRTLIHELEHVAQMDRKDKKLILGHAAIWGLAVVGAVAGNVLSSRKTSRLLPKTIATIGGALIGQQVGYKLAPHEAQAQHRAHEITTTAIKRQNTH